MQIDVLPAGPIETNAYLLTAESGESLLVDAPPAVEGAVRERLAQRGARLAAILVTHGHWDHIGDLGKFRGDGVDVYAHAGDREWIENPAIMAAFMPPGLEVIPGRVDRWVGDGEKLEVAGAAVEVRHVPGHAPGNILFYFPGLAAAFVGDALFRGGVGRFDLPGGDWPTLERSIRERIFTLPGETAVYPGHGPATTVMEEMRNNPFVGSGTAG
jgi:hydroxyacylglutathione hydrolase